MDSIAAWLQEHVASAGSAQYLRNLAGMLVGLVAVWYVAKQLAGRGSSAAALNVAS